MIFSVEKVCPDEQPVAWSAPGGTDSLHWNHWLWEDNVSWGVLIGFVYARGGCAFFKAFKRNS